MPLCRRVINKLILDMANAQGAGGVMFGFVMVWWSDDSGGGRGGRQKLSAPQAHLNTSPFRVNLKFSDADTMFLSQRYEDRAYSA
jgi:hypothetical protein